MREVLLPRCSWHDPGVILGRLCATRVCFLWKVNGESQTWTSNAELSLAALRGKEAWGIDGHAWAQTSEVFMQISLWGWRQIHFQISRWQSFPAVLAKPWVRKKKLCLRRLDLPRCSSWYFLTKIKPISWLKMSWDMFALVKRRVDRKLQVIKKKNGC